ncbi:MAG: hypothetical protein CMG64_03865 [Candidatus Marinimicrobia bacterium]|nr:hypothetical protein [Candidatus Neomarinimicrobiota bacterium]|tara:strand:+ start:11792 stop:12640 length:849 start_codon:yes stop_codon:yes gene_type:complete
MESFKSPVIITGMHRSGTTLLSRILDDQGVFMGYKKEENNESIFFLKLNQWILSLGGCSWDNPCNLNHLYNKQIIIDRMNQIIDSRLNFLYHGYLNILSKKSFYKMTNHWGWKDPRNTFTVEFWFSLFPDAKIINIYRNPLAVSNSLLIRQNKLIEKDKEKKIKLKNKIASLLPIFHSSVLSSTILNDINDCLLLYKKYQDMDIKNSNKYSNQYLSVCYEDLILNSDVVLGRVFKYLNVDVDYFKLEKMKNKFNPKRINAYKDKEYAYNQNLLDQINYSLKK